MTDDYTIILAGDNHLRREPIKDLLNMYPEADFFLHMGDSEETVTDLEGWICVAGNTDYDPNLPLERVITVGNHHILLVHGDRMIYNGGYVSLACAGKDHGCDIVCFGHTHRYADKTVEGVRLLNPGSLKYNRDRSATGYMIIRIHGDDITSERKYL